jgi:hypothetical protein
VKTITYTYRGLVERGTRYDWREGYSETSPDGGIYYPWMTKRECQQDAMKQGSRAVFIRPAQPQRWTPQTARAQTGGTFGT